MDGAKELAKRMADAINVDSNYLRGLFQGFINLPVDFCYLGYDFLDTEHRSENFDDRARFMCLVKTGALNRRTMEKIIHVFVDQFVQKIDFDELKK
ncbi:hypothetical protein [Mixta theicola]|uniref:hypothetical protein n=1 Tax=Mixta theicola TaxID=1458355 RepID=UPI001F0C7973|nr:hypothetical protein [Mixta theicola]GLR09639.1 hypothetical protein GCM10007905_23590 [Mixta theicola]